MALENKEAAKRPGPTEIRWRPTENLTFVVLPAHLFAYLSPCHLPRSIFKVLLARAKLGSGVREEPVTVVRFRPGL